MITAEPSGGLTVTQTNLPVNASVHAHFDFVPDDPAHAKGKNTSGGPIHTGAQGLASYFLRYAQITGFTLTDDFGGPPGTITAYFTDDDPDASTDPIDGFTVSERYPPQ